MNNSQKEVLRCLLKLYEQRGVPIPMEDLRKQLSARWGVLKADLQVLRGMGLVEGIPGPRGGYVPTLKAYEALDMSAGEKMERVAIHSVKEKKAIEDVSVEEIRFVDLSEPEELTVVVKVRGDTRKVRGEELVRIGPATPNKIVIEGVVVGRDDERGLLRLKPKCTFSIPADQVNDIATKRLIWVPPEMSIIDCARILIENRIDGVPVIRNNELVGIVTRAEVVKASVKGECNKRVEDIAVKDVLTVEKDTKLEDCLRKMEEHDVGRLIVTDQGKPVGIVTRTDVLVRLMSRKY